MSAGRGSSECQMSALVLSLGLFAIRPAALNNLVPAHCALIDAPLAFFQVLLSLGADGEVVKLVCIQRAQRREESVIGPVVRTVENSQMQWAGWARNHGSSLNHLFSMKHRGPEVDLASSARSGVSFEVERVP